MYHQIDQKQGTRQHFKSTPGHSLFVLHCIRQFHVCRIKIKLILYLHRPKARIPLEPFYRNFFFPGFQGTLMI